MSVQPLPPDPAHTAPTDEPRSGADGAPLADMAVVAQLLTLAGPTGAAALLAQIVTDLADVRSGLCTAQSSGDGVAMRRASHVLVSLSGTIGAQRTCALARDLTGADPATPPDRLGHMASALLADIDRLTADLATVAAKGAAA